MACLRPLETSDHMQQNKGPEGPRLDKNGMVLPHSILGTLEDFRSYLEAKGETEWIRCIPELTSENVSEAVVVAQGGSDPSSPGLPDSSSDAQSKALEHWSMHMEQRRKQKDFLSKSLHKPVETLLMNQADDFRKVQELRELLSRALPAIRPGYGHRVGSEFWSLPQYFGDELSGITSTLTRTQRGEWEPIVHVVQPYTVKRESGNVCPETCRPATRTWYHSEYLYRQHQELRGLLQEIDLKTPEIDSLEVIGRGLPVTSVSVCRNTLLNEEVDKQEEEEATVERENPTDAAGQRDQVPLEALVIPALRFCGERARWTGSATSYQGEVGISARMNFQVVVGETARSHLDLRNEGSTAIYYTWQKLPLARSFPHLHGQTTTPHFFFNSSTGVILPGDTQWVEFTFKSGAPGIKSELWQLNTHPMLLGGATMQVTLRGVALYQDRTAEQRLLIERELEKKVAQKVCCSLVYQVLQGVHTPERAISPVELDVTEEQEFLWRNPKLQYFYEPVEGLKRLWKEVAPEENDWDLSVETLRQAVLYLPREGPDPESDLESDHQPLTRDWALGELNALLLELTQLPFKPVPQTKSAIGRQLWRELLDGLTTEDMWVRHVLGLPETETWTSATPEEQPAQSLLEEDKSEEMGRAGAKEEKRPGSGAERRDSKGNKSPVKCPSHEEHALKKGRGEEEGPGYHGGKECYDSASSEDIHHDELEDTVEKYRTHMHQQVYVLMEGLVDSLCCLVDSLAEEE